MTFEDLNSVRRISEELQAEKERLETLRQSVLPVQNVDGLPKSKLNDSRVEKLITLITECENRIEDLRLKLFDAKAAVMEVLVHSAEITPLMFQVLLLRYVDCLAYNEIALKLSYSRDYIFKVSRKAVKQLTHE